MKCAWCNKKPVNGVAQCGPYNYLCPDCYCKWRFQTNDIPPKGTGWYKRYMRVNYGIE